MTALSCNSTRHHNQKHGGSARTVHWKRQETTTTGITKTMDSFSKHEDKDDKHADDTEQLMNADNPKGEYDL